MNKPRRLAKYGLLVGSVTAVAALAVGYWIPVKAEMAQRLLARAWDETLAGQTDAKPWPWADTSPASRLSIPSLNASWVVLSGASGRNLAFAPSHMDGSAEPGERGLSVIAGHRDTHFEVLERIPVGTEIFVEDRHSFTHHYRVVATEIVDSRQTSLRLDADTPLLVLVTCYPFDAISAGGPLRYLVFAEATGS